MRREDLTYAGWWRILLPGFLLIFVTNGLALSGIQVFDPYLLADLGSSAGRLKFGDFLLLVSSASCAAGVGYLADKVPVRALVAVGLAALAAALMLHGRVTSLPELYMARVVMGFGLACSGLVVCVTIVSRWFVRQRGTALGLLLAGTSLGNAAFPGINVWLIQQHGWRHAFVILGAIPLALIPVVLLLWREWPSAGPADQPIEAAVPRAPPLAYGTILQMPQFWLLVLASFTTFYGILAINGNLALHLTRLDLPPAAIGRAFALMFILGLIGKILSGTMADLVGSTAAWLGMLGLMLVGAALLASLSPALLWAGIVCFGFGWGGNFTLIHRQIADTFGAQSTGRALGAINAIDTVGGALGPWVTAVLYDRAASYRPGFLVVTAFVVVALGAGTALARQTRRSPA